MWWPLQVNDRFKDTIVVFQFCSISVSENEFFQNVRFLSRMLIRRMYPERYIFPKWKWLSHTILSHIILIEKKLESIPNSKMGILSSKVPCSIKIKMTEISSNHNKKLVKFRNDHGILNSHVTSWHSSAKSLLNAF